MPPSSPRMSWKRVMPCFATNSRTFFWLLAVLGDSAGTRWSKMMAIFDGSQIFGSRFVPRKTAWNWLRTRAAFSWDMARSTAGSTTSPARTASRPEARARIFSTTVMGIRQSPSLSGPPRLSFAYPRPTRTSSVCAPRRGGGEVIAPGVFDSCAVRPKSFTSPISSSTFTGWRTLRCSTCGWARAAFRERMSPEGTSLALSASTQCAVGFCFSFSSTSGVSALRFFFRSSRSWNRGSVLSSGAPMHLGHRLPLLLLVGGDVDVAVLGRERCPRARR